ncbi:non-ribosomal peptide synthetase [Pleionea sp. CnH1-48]|uniref:non-ribosomal peptide synthetase n=1 Tax=Pleionea sp. CnH1-48 TaxID=2954494 RepID=UPI0020974777|nr:non-ribosomal peptide synthetase [Pleionea sp. CnH1-48]MCO7224320.1 amino acid adenylation domain-containing protein [Pleionea sp. CnH1-48]
MKAFLEELALAGVEVSLNENKLKVRAQKGKLSPELLERIKQNKSQLQDYLQELTVSNAAHNNMGVDAIVPRTTGTAKVKASSAQQRLWMLDHIAGGSAEYNMPMAFRTPTTFDINIAELALRKVIERHQVLRTRLQMESSVLMQIIDESFDFHILRYEVSGDNAQAEIEQLIADDSEKVFRLDRDLMLRALWIKQEEYGGTLLVNMHHIATDGWSMSILMDEFAFYYESISQGDNSELEPLPIQYADFAHWQHQWLTPDILDKQTEYWRKQLQDVPEVHQLPLDFQRPAQRSVEGGILANTLDASLTQQVLLMAQKLDVTPFVFLHGVLALVVSRHSQQQDIVIGTPVANRTRKEIEGLIGFFVNTLVLRVNTEQASIRDYFDHVKQVNIGAQSHQDLSFEQLVEISQVSRSQSYTSLFQIMFSMDVANASGSSQSSLAIEPLSDEKLVNKFDLDVSAAVENDQLYIEWIYDTSLFTATTVNLFASHFEQLLKSLVAESESTRLEDLSLSSSGEQREVLQTLNQTFSAYDQTKLAHQSFEQQVKSNPHSIAIQNAQDSLTYVELNQKANQYAHWLIEQGCRPEQTVAVYLPRSVDSIIALLAIQKAGGTYLPIDIDYPQERVDFILKDAQPKWILMHSSTPVLTAQKQTEVVQLDKLSTLLEGYSQANPEQMISAEHLSYIMYTSGSTGQPKGVMIEHGQLMHFVHVTQENYHITINDKVLQFASFAFDISIEEIFGALCHGATLVLRDDQCVQDSQHFWRFCQQQGITLASLPTAFWHQLVASGLPDNSGALRLMILGGEAIKASYVEQWFAQWTNKVALYNTYGPTEATVTACGHLMHSATHAPLIPIGKANPNTQLYVLDAMGNPVAKGMVGELYIGGQGIARGYLNQPELTRNAFVQLPIAQTPLYRSGDLVRYRADGLLVYMGRNDRQVKIRGYRVEPEEVAETLLALPAIEQAHVLVQSDADDNKRLIAYVCGKELSIKEMSKAAQQQMPEYMVPAAFVLLDELPLTINGKVNEKALPEPDTRDFGGDDYIAPKTQSEQSLASIWCDLLGLERVSRDDHFFKLGGHSLLAIRLVSEVRSKLQQELDVKAVFKDPRLSSVARLLESEPQQNNNDIVPVKRDAKRYPLSYSQQRLWFIDNMEEGTPEYNMPFALQVSGTFDIKAAEQALNKIIQRHEILRTSYHSDEEGAWQSIHHDVRVELKVIDLSILEASKQQEAIEQWQQQDSSSLFDLSQAPLLRAHYLLQSSTQGVLLFNMHHIASDGWSIGVLCDEFMALYSSFVSAELTDSSTHPQINELPIQYLDYAVWQQQRLQGESLKRMQDYWLTQLADLPVVHDLPLDFSRSAELSNEGAHYDFVLDNNVLARLRQQAQATETTLFMLLQGAFALLLGRTGQATDVVMGTPVANRHHSHLEPLIGFFVNTLVLRLQCAGEQSLADFIEQLKQVHQDAQAHQEMPFEWLVQQLQPERSRAYSPLFQIMFSMDTHTTQSFAMDGLHIDELEAQNVTAQFELTLDASESDEGLEFVFEYNRSLFTQSSIARMAEAFKTLVTSLAYAQDFSLPIAHLSWVSEAEKRFLLENFNPADIEYPTQQGIHHLFEQQAAQTPNALAVIDGDVQISYEELQQHINLAAHHLVEHNVATGDFVALHMERHLEAVVMVLAVMKAGAAYVPLDNALPADRLQMILESCTPTLIISDETLEGIATSVPCKRVADFLTPADQLTLVDLPLSDQQLAYMVYTSGTTGKPKGVMVEHEAMLARAEGWFETFGLREQPPQLLQMAGLAVDIFLGDIVKSLTTGGSLVLCRKEDLVDSEQLFQLIQQHRISFGDFVPVVLRNLLDYAEQHQQTLPWLRHILVGSEAWYGRDLSRLQAVMAPEARCFNIYGQTESVIDVSYGDVTQTHLAADSVVPIGTPLANTTLFILDEHRQLVPRGVVGELAVGGSGLARGYHQNDSLTKEKFIVDHLTQSGGRIYLTGDQARLTEQGQLEFVGRNDDQIKLRGFRIELSEITARLRTLNAISNAVVLVHQLNSGERQIVAYLQTQVSLDLEQVRTELMQSLPHYMIPAAFVCMEQFPVSITGKVDKARLPKPQLEDYAHQEFEVAEGEIETIIANAFAQVLQLEQVGRHDNFFALGGDSILMVRVVTLCQKQGLAVTVKDLLMHQTVMALAAQAHTQDASKVDQDNEYVAFSLLTEAERENLIKEEGVEDAYPLSNLQLGSIYHQLKDQSYHIVEHYPVEEIWNEQAFKSAFENLLQRHEVLRASYRFTATGAIQVIKNNVELPVTLHRWDNLTNEAFDQQLEQWLEQEEEAFFDANELMWRVHAFVHPAGHFVIGFAHQHAILDGWSVANLKVEFMENYHAAMADNKPVTRSACPPFGAYIAAELEASQSKEAQAYWQKVVHDAPLPHWTGKAANDHFAQRLDVSYLAKDLDTLSTQLKLPVRTLMLAVHCFVLAKVNGSDSVITSVVSHGRLESEHSDSALGLFLNTPPLHVGGAHQNWQTWLKQTEQQLNEHWTYRHYPVALMQEKLERDFSGALFNYVNFHVADQLQTPDVNHTDVDSDITDVEHERVDYGYDFECQHSPAHGSLVLQLALTTSHFTAQQCRDLLGYYATAIQSLLNSQQHLLGHQDYLSPAMMTQLKQWGNANALVTASTSLPELFAQGLAIDNGQSVALKGDWGSMTYEQLDKASNCLAHEMSLIGVQTNTSLGLYFTGGAESIIAILAVVKLQATFVPLAVEHPQERLQQMIQDAGVQWILTRSQDEVAAKEFALPLISVNKDRRKDTLPLVVSKPLANTEQVSYVMYTSGSTGLPKGIRVSADNLLSYHQAVTAAYGIQTSATVLQIANMGFDIFIEELMLSIFSGGCLVLDETKHLVDLTSLPQLIQQQNISVLSMPTALWHEWTQLLTTQSTLQGLTHCLVGGEAMQRDALQQWQHLVGHSVRLFNTYGPTETTVVAAAIDVSRWTSEQEHTIPLGKPLANCEIYLMDHSGEPVAPGAIGEVVIGGQAVSLGYINRPEQQASHFIQAPDWLATDSLLYRTGDQAFWNAQGELIYCGRNDAQVKIRGYRIEVAEVELTLAQLPQVSSAIVRIEKQHSEQPKLAAWLVPSETVDEAFWLQNIQNELNKRLPEYMLPELFAVLPSLPLNNNGKVDTKALPTPQRLLQNKVIRLPQTEVESVLRSNCAKLLNLNIDKVSMADSFLELGGHSLTLLRLLHLIQQHYQVEVSVSEALTANDLSELAFVVDKKILQQTLATATEDDAISDEGWL